MTPSDNTVLDGRLRIMRIIVSAQILGALLFAGIAVFLRQSGQAGKPPDTPMVSYVSLPFGVINLALSLVIPNFAALAVCRRIAQGTWQTPPETANQLTTDTDKLWSVYQTRLIIGLAFVEGVVFLLLIAFLLEETIACLIAAIVLIAYQAARMPSRSGVESWVEKQMAWIEQERGAM